MIFVLNTLGLADDNLISVYKNAGDLKESIFVMPGNSNLIADLDFDDITVKSHVFGGVVEAGELTLSRSCLIFNSICSPENSQRTLRIVNNIVKQSGFPVINHPLAVMKSTRSGVAETLAGIDEKIKVPKCVMIAPRSIKEVYNFIKVNKFPFPLIFRTAGDHGSKNMVKIDSIKDLGVLEMFAFNGENKFYMIEFVDYKSPDGYYRKARYWVVGDEIIPRHLVVADDWNIFYDMKKNVMKDRVDFQAEEKSFVENGCGADYLCLKMKDALGLDFFGVDCSIDDEGNMLIFEVTPSMTLADDPNFEYINDAVGKTRDAVGKLIRQKAKKCGML